MQSNMPVSKYYVEFTSPTYTHGGGARIGRYRHMSGMLNLDRYGCRYMWLTLALGVRQECSAP
jgi:hypothetical protein